MRAQEFLSLLTENQQTLSLPPIPAEYSRLTHFTNIENARSIIQTGFRAKQGLSTTTDSFSNNNDIESLIVSGKTGTFDRSTFGAGEATIIIDVPGLVDRRGREQFVPSTSILGYVDRKTMKLITNPGYAPERSKFTISNNHKIEIGEPPTNSVVAVPSPLAGSPSSANDIF